MFGKGNKSKGAKIDTLIGQNTEIRGDVHFTGGLHIDGRVKGNVLADDDGSVLSLSERGEIVGEVRVPNVVLNGAVNGDVYAAHHIELAAKARVTGNVYYKIIEMARGAEVNGNLVHRTDNADKAPAKTPEKSPEKPADKLAETTISSATGTAPAKADS